MIKETVLGETIMVTYCYRWWTNH